MQPSPSDAPRFAPIVALDGADPARTSLYAMEVGHQGEAHLRLACAVGALLDAHDADPSRRPLAVMVSLSLVELERLDIGSVTVALEDNGVDADRLIVRVPRYAAGARSPVLDRLAAAGVTVDVADLIVAPHEASLLAGAPVDMIELPAALVDDADRHPGNTELLEKWLGLAHRIDWLVLARNVRRPTQARVLHRLGCDLVAGPLMGAPIDPSLGPGPARAREARSSLTG